MPAMPTRAIFRIAVTTHHDCTALVGADAFVVDVNQRQPEDLMGHEGSAHGCCD